MNNIGFIQQIFDKNPEHAYCVFLNGFYSAELSRISMESSVEQTAEGLFIRIAENTKLIKPIHILYLQVDREPFISHRHNSIVIEKNSECTIIEEYVSLYVKDYNVQRETHLIAHANSKINYFKIQNDGCMAAHKARIQIKQFRDSLVNAVTLSMGGKSAEENLHVELTEPGASCQLHGFYGLKQDHQQNDHHVHVNHLAENSQSQMLYKGILDKKSRAGFCGKVHVHKEAQKIHAQQANHNLLLSKEAEVNSKPELEIYADDVKCTHGSTVGQLDQEALFYFQSRGIDKQTGTQILLRSFVDEVLQKITDNTFCAYAENLLRENFLND